MITHQAAEEREALALLEQPTDAEDTEREDDGAALPARLRVVAPGLQVEMKHALAAVRAGDEALKRIEHLRALQRIDPAEFWLQVWERPTSKGRRPSRHHLRDPPGRDVRTEWHSAARKWLLVDPCCEAWLAHIATRPIMVRSHRVMKDIKGEWSKVSD